MKNKQIERDQYVLHLFRVFRIKYDRLQELNDSDDVDSSLEISAILRHFLMDGNRLADDVTNNLGLQCSFPVSDEYISKKSLVFSKGFVPKNNATTYYNRNKFLRLTCFQLNRKTFTVEEIIELVANCGGGVHHDGSKSKLRKYVTSLLETDTANDCLDCLQKISSILIEGLSQARKAIDAEFSFLEQRKRKRQPEILLSKNGKSRIYFDGKSSLEGYCRLQLDKSGCILFSFIPSKFQSSYPSTVFEMGSRQENRKISLQIIDQSRLSLRLYNSAKDFEECIFPYVPMINNILFINYIRTVESTKFEVLIANRTEHLEELISSSSWSLIEGKVIIGQDLKSRNGAEFQSNMTLAFWDYYHDIEKIRQMLSNYFNGRQDTWLQNSTLNDRCYVTKIYNQCG